MQRYEITGMSCAACASHVEKAVSAVPGVAGVAVSLLTNSMQVDYTPDADPDTTARRICNAVEAAGYGASLATAESENAELEDTETPKLKKRLIASLCFLVPLMYVSMGHMIGLPLPSFMEGHGSGAMVFALVQLALTLPVCWINRAFFISGWKGIKSRAPGMDALVSMGAGAALLYGLYAIVMIGIGLKNDDMELIMQYRHDLYFESAATILTLITVGKTLEAYSKGKTTDALKSLMKLAPQTACVLRDSEQVMLPVSEVQVGDLFLVRPGESIPVDGNKDEPGPKGVVFQPDHQVGDRAAFGFCAALLRQRGDALGFHLSDRRCTVCFHRHLPGRGIPGGLAFLQVGVLIGHGGIGVTFGYHKVALVILGVGVAGGKRQQIPPRLDQHRGNIRRVDDLQLCHAVN